MDHYYILEGKKAKAVNDVFEWAAFMQSGFRNVKRTEVSNIVISTVFLGIDYSFGTHPPLLFETMIFGGEHDGYCERCSTWEEAEAQHQEAIDLIFQAD